MGDRFLMHGPLGCNKRLITQAVANEASLGFIHVKVIHHFFTKID